MFRGQILKTLNPKCLLPAVSIKDNRIEIRITVRIIYSIFRLI